MTLAHVRAVAAAGTFASGGYRHVYASFHADRPIVLAACGQWAIADQPVPVGTDMEPCSCCAIRVTPITVRPTGTESEGESDGNRPR